MLTGPLQSGVTRKAVGRLCVLAVLRVHVLPTRQAERRVGWGESLGLKPNLFDSLLPTRPGSTGSLSAPAKAVAAQATSRMFRPSVLQPEIEGTQRSASTEAAWSFSSRGDYHIRLRDLNLEVLRHCEGLCPFAFAAILVAERRSRGVY